MGKARPPDGRPRARHRPRYVIDIWRDGEELRIRPYRGTGRALWPEIITIRPEDLERFDLQQRHRDQLEAEGRTRRAVERHVLEDLSGMPVQEAIERMMARMEARDAEELRRYERDRAG